ncbi:hypothetical protein EJ06DRAFT_559631 [Trichodelitschia bisporula]|uniref:Uncharacterized protein n=1 Tax=Trichodelitschia bisporula TaxID=703511 RepID=A0A6G1HK92_9PEZI|nr:hypothetical protein EJ06DRAFT_559631 [Trichodelitschia bisporula]
MSSGLNLLMTSIGNSLLHRIKAGMKEMRISAMQYVDASGPPSYVSEDPDDQGNDDKGKGKGEEEREVKYVEPQEFSPKDYPYNQHWSNIDALPFILIPQKELIDAVSALPPSAHAEIAHALASNIQVASYRFYRRHLLSWDQKALRSPDAYAPLFADIDELPKAPESLTIEQWLGGIVSTHMNGCCPGLIRNEEDFHRSAVHLLRISAFWTPWKSLELLDDWGSLARLKLMWKILHPDEFEHDDVEWVYPEGWMPDLSRVHALPWNPPASQPSMVASISAPAASASETLPVPEENARPETSSAESTTSMTKASGAASDSLEGKRKRRSSLTLFRRPKKQSTLPDE